MFKTLQIVGERYVLSIDRCVTSQRYNFNYIENANFKKLLHYTSKFIAIWWSFLWSFLNLAGGHIVAKLL